MTCLIPIELDEDDVIGLCRLRDELQENQENDVSLSQVVRRLIRKALHPDMTINDEE